jgi:hypothetical protein
MLCLFEFAPPLEETDTLVKLHTAWLLLACVRALSHKGGVCLYGRLATGTIRLENNLSLIPIGRKHGDDIVRQLGVGKRELDGALGALLSRVGIGRLRIAAESVEEFLQDVIPPWCDDEGQIDILPFHDRRAEQMPA